MIMDSRESFIEAMQALKPHGEFNVWTEYHEGCVNCMALRDACIAFSTMLHRDLAEHGECLVVVLENDTCTACSTAILQEVGI